jgi:hypothetical protein
VSERPIIAVLAPLFRLLVARLASNPALMWKLMGLLQPVLPHVKKVLGEFDKRT